MTKLDQLRQAVYAAQQANDLPDVFALRILALCENPRSRALEPSALDDLIDKLGDYDTYGQTGYLGMGVSDLILQRTLDRLESNL